MSYLSCEGGAYVGADAGGKRDAVFDLPFRVNFLALKMGGIGSHPELSGAEIFNEQSYLFFNEHV